MSLSVLLAVCSKDKPQQLARALESIWQEQTRKPDQIVVVVDGPLGHELDDTLELWAEACEGQLDVVRLEQNHGLGVALNKGLTHCRSSLVARMDADDISLPERFEKQVSFMNENRHISLSSALIEEFQNEWETSATIRIIPEKQSEIKKFAKKRNPINHPAMIFRRSVLESVGGYPEFRKAQDWALVCLLLHQGYRLGNLLEPIVRMRTDPAFQERRGIRYLMHELRVINYQKSIGFISWGELVFSLVTRVLLRMAPKPLRRWVYRNFRDAKA